MATMRNIFSKYIKNKPNFYVLICLGNRYSLKHETSGKKNHTECHSYNKRKLKHKDDIKFSNDA